MLKMNEVKLANGNVVKVAELTRTQIIAIKKLSLERMFTTKEDMIIIDEVYHINELKTEDELRAMRNAIVKTFSQLTEDTFDENMMNNMQSITTYIDSKLMKMGCLV